MGGHSGVIEEPEISLMSSNVSIMFAWILQLIKDSDWIPARNKAMMIHKLAAMIVYIGSPPHLGDLTGTEHRMAMRRVFVLNIMYIRKSKAEYRLTAFSRKFTRKGLIWSILKPRTVRESQWASVWDLKL